MCKCNVLVHLTAVTCCKNSVFIFFLSLNSDWGRNCCKWERSQKGTWPRLLLPPVLLWSHLGRRYQPLLAGYWDLGGVSFSLTWDWRDEGAPGRRQLHWGLAGAAAEQPALGFSEETPKPDRFFPSLCPDIVLTVSLPQLYSVFLYGPQIACLLSFWLNFLNKPIGNDK